MEKALDFNYYKNLKSIAFMLRFMPIKMCENFFEGIIFVMSNNIFLDIEKKYQKKNNFLNHHFDFRTKHLIDSCKWCESQNRLNSGG